MTEDQKDAAAAANGERGWGFPAFAHDFPRDAELDALVAKMGGNTMILPAGQMPTRSGLAATYRY